MIKILSQRFSFPSARLLGNSLQTLVGQQVIVTSYPFRIKDKFIRYGNSESVNIKDTEFNPAQFIHLCSSKLAFSRLMESNDIYSPIYYNDPQKIERYPIVIRETLTSYGGRGIRIVHSLDELNWRPAFYWTPYISLCFELRVHILGGKIVKIFKKELENKMEFPIRNNSSCHFSLKTPQCYPKLLESVNELLKIPEINQGRFFSLDVGWNKESKEYFFIEANSASGLNENTAEIYARYLVENI